MFFPKQEHKLAFPFDFAMTEQQQEASYGPVVDSDHGKAIIPNENTATLTQVVQPMTTIQLVDMIDKSESNKGDSTSSNDAIQKEGQEMDNSLDDFVQSRRNRLMDAQLNHERRHHDEMVLTMSVLRQKEESPSISPFIAPQPPLLSEDKVSTPVASNRSKEESVANNLMQEQELQRLGETHPPTNDLDYLGVPTRDREMEEIQRDPEDENFAFPIMTSGTIAQQQGMQQQIPMIQQQHVVHGMVHGVPQAAIQPSRTEEELHALIRLARHRLIEEQLELARGYEFEMELALSIAFYQQLLNSRNEDLAKLLQQQQHQQELEGIQQRQVMYQHQKQQQQVKELYQQQHHHDEQQHLQHLQQQQQRQQQHLSVKQQGPQFPQTIQVPTIAHGLFDQNRMLWASEDDSSLALREEVMQLQEEFMESDCETEVYKNLNKMAQQEMQHSMQHSMQH